MRKEVGRVRHLGLVPGTPSTCIERGGSPLDLIQTPPNGKTGAARSEGFGRSRPAPAPRPFSPAQDQATFSTLPHPSPPPSPPFSNSFPFFFQNGLQGCRQCVLVARQLPLKYRADPQSPSLLLPVSLASFGRSVFLPLGHQNKSFWVPCKMQRLTLLFSSPDPLQQGDRAC